MQYQLTSFKVLVYSFVTAACAVSIANAQQEADTHKKQATELGLIEDVVITAQRKAERLQDVPISVSVASGQSLTAFNLSTLEAVSLRQADVVIRPAPGGDQLFIRGAGSGFNPGFEQSVATFVDDVYRPRGRASRVALFDVDRVEILKGPQTTYFGANAIGGALNITTRKPREDFGANLSAFYSPDLNEQSIEAGVDLPLGDKLAFRVAGRTFGMDSITRNTRINERGKQSTNQLRASMELRPSDSITIGARFDYARIDDTGDTALEAIGCPPLDGLVPRGQCARALSVVGAFDDRLDRKNQTGFLDSYLSDFHEGALEADFDVGFGRVVATSGYQTSESAVILENIPVPVSSVLGIPTLLMTDLSEEYKQFSQELRFEGSLSDRIDLMVGAYYESSNLRNFFNLGFFQAPFGALAVPYFSADDLIVSIANVKQSSDTTSAFGTIHFKLADTLKLTAGLRYSNITKEAVRQPFIAKVRAPVAGLVPNLRDAVPGPLPGQIILASTLGASLSPFAKPSVRESQLMPSISISYSPTHDLMAYGSFVRGYKAGGFNFQYSPDTFDSESVDSYEVGVKATWLDGRAMTNVAVFTADYADLQEAGNVFTPSGAIVSFIGNVAESRSRGIEFDGALAITESLQLTTNIAYLDSEYRKYPNAPCSPLQSFLAAQGQYSCPQDLSNVTRPNSPKWSGSLGFAYSRSLGNSLRLDFGGLVYGRTDYFLQAIPEEITSQEGYTKVDLRAAISGGMGGDGNWTVALIGRNLTDEMTASLKGHLPTAAGSALAIAEQGRSIGIKVSIELGGN